MIIDVWVVEVNLLRAPHRFSHNGALSSILLTCIYPFCFSFQVKLKDTITFATSLGEVTNPIIHLKISASHLKKKKIFSNNVSRVYLSSAPSLGFDLAMNKQMMSLYSGLPMGPPRLPLLPWPSDTIQDVVKKLKQDMADLS